MTSTNVDEKNRGGGEVTQNIAPWPSFTLNINICRVYHKIVEGKIKGAWGTGDGNTYNLNPWPSFSNSNTLLDKSQSNTMTIQLGLCNPIPRQQQKGPCYINHALNVLHNIYHWPWGRPTTFLNVFSLILNESFIHLIYWIKNMLYSIFFSWIHWGKADDRNCIYGHPKMADVESGKNLFCRLNCFYNVF